MSYIQNKKTKKLFYKWQELSIGTALYAKNQCTDSNRLLSPLATQHVLGSVAFFFCEPSLTNEHMHTTDINKILANSKWGYSVINIISFTSGRCMFCIVAEEGFNILVCDNKLLLIRTQINFLCSDWLWTQQQKTSSEPGEPQLVNVCCTFIRSPAR